MADVATRHFSSGSSAPSMTPIAPAPSTSNSSNGNSSLYRRTKSARRSERRRISEEGLGVWTRVEHERFLEGKRLFPNGPWKLVAEFVGTRNTRQTMTHAQKYRQKLERRQRGLRTTRKSSSSDDEHLVAPELYYTSSPHVGRSSAAARSRTSPKGVDTAKLVIPTVSAACPSLAPPTKCGAFEQLLLGDAIYAPEVSTTVSSTSTSSSFSDAALGASSSSSSNSEGCLPAQHTDVELPWLDECLDYLILNLS